MGRCEIPCLSWLKQLIPAFWATIRSAMQGNRRDWWYGLRMVVMILAPLPIAALLTRFPGFSDSANFLVLGALFTALVAPNGTYGMRARTMVLGACLLAFACFCGTLLGNQLLLALVVVAFWTFGAGMLTAFGRVGATLSYVATACFVIPLAEPANLEQAWLRSVILLSGAFWAMTVMLWDWPLRRYQPFCKAVVAYYHALRALLTPLRLSMSGRSVGGEHGEADFWAQWTRVQNTRKEAHQIRDERPRDSSPTARRLALFLERADALFDVQTSLAVSLRTMLFQAYPTSVQETLARGIIVVEKTLACLAEALRRGKPSDKERELAQTLHEVTERLTVAGTFSPERETDILALAHLQHLLYLFEQLTTLCQTFLAEMENAVPDLPSVQAKPHKSLRTVLIDAWQTLAEHLTTRSRILRYALRLSITASLATAISLLLHIPHGYWMPMSVAILLKPDFHATRQRIRQRLGGTIAGGLLAGVLSIVLYEPGLLLALMALLCFLAFLARSRHYGVYAFFLTTFLVLSIDIGHLGNWTVALVRVASNLVGAILVYLAVSLLWPQWEHEQLPDQMSRTMSAIRRFFQTVMSKYLVPSPSTAPMKKARQLATRECLKATALVKRLSHEPKSNLDDVARYEALLTPLQRLCESMTALSMQNSFSTGHETLLGLPRLLEQMEKALQEEEEALTGERQAKSTLPLEESLCAVQDALRAMAMERLDEQTPCFPDTPHQNLLGMYAPLSIHLPSLVRHTRALSPPSLCMSNGSTRFTGKHEERGKRAVT